MKMKGLRKLIAIGALICAMTASTLANAAELDSSVLDVQETVSEEAVEEAETIDAEEIVEFEEETVESEDEIVSIDDDFIEINDVAASGISLSDLKAMTPLTNGKAKTDACNGSPNWYSIKQTEFGYFTVNLKLNEGSGATNGWNFRIYHEGNLGSSIYESGTISSYTGGTSPTIALGPGLYAVEIIPYWSSTKEQYDLTYNFYKDSHFVEKETMSSETSANATKINLNTLYKGTYGYSGDIDYYKFDITENGYFTVTISPDELADVGSYGWDYRRGITTGTSDTAFSPNATVTRGQFVTFLYRYKGKPSASGNCPFNDVPSDKFYYKPVIWAAKNGVTTGTSPNAFSPENPCTRGQVVTFIYRAFN